MFHQTPYGQESSDGITQRMLEASNYSTIEARIEDNGLRDFIDYARKAMSRVSVGITGNQNMTKAEEIFEEFDYLPKNKCMYVNID